MDRIRRVRNDPLVHVGRSRPRTDPGSGPLPGLAACRATRAGDLQHAVCRLHGGRVRGQAMATGTGPHARGHDADRRLGGLLHRPVDQLLSLHVRVERARVQHRIVALGISRARSVRAIRGRHPVGLPPIHHDERGRGAERLLDTHPAARKIPRHRARAGSRGGVRIVFPRRHGHRGHLHSLRGVRVPPRLQQPHLVRRRAAPVSAQRELLRRCPGGGPDAVHALGAGERGSERFAVRYRTAVRCLAVVGFTFVVYAFGYFFPWSWMSITPDSVIDVPSYMRPGPV